MNRIEKFGEVGLGEVMIYEYGAYVAWESTRPNLNAAQTSAPTAILIQHLTFDAITSFLLPCHIYFFRSQVSWSA